MAQNPEKNKNTSLAPGTNTGYNKKNGGSYTGSTTGFETKKSPLKTKTDFTAPKEKKTVYTPDIPKTRPPKSPDYFQTARKTQNNLNKPLPRIDDAPKYKPPKSPDYFQKARQAQNNLNKPLPRIDTAPQSPIADEKTVTNEYAKKYNLPNWEERNFAMGAFGEEGEKQAYNKMLGNILNPPKPKSRDQLFREGYEGIEEETYTPDYLQNILQNLNKPAEAKEQAPVAAQTPGEQWRAAIKNAQDDVTPTIGVNGYERPWNAEFREKSLAKKPRSALDQAVHGEKISLVPPSNPTPARPRNITGIVGDFITENWETIERYIEDAFLVASAVPGIDTFTNLGSAVFNLFRGRWGDAALDAFSAIPVVGEAGDTAKYARRGVKLINGADDVADGVRALSRFDDAWDTVRAIDRTDDAIDTAKAAGKVDDVQGINKLLNMDKLPNDSSELAGLGWKEITPEGMKTHTTSKMYEKDGMKIVFDEATPNAEGFGGKNHYHVLNPNSTSKHDYYLDKNGNPVPKNSKQSHIIP